MDADRIVAQAQAAAAASAAPVPRGIRNNNPGNLEGATIPWKGQIGVDGAYCVFDTPEHGLRALAVNLLAYQKLHGLNTVRLIVTRFAPPSENDTAAYIADVAAQMMVDPNATLDLTEPPTLDSLVCAITRHENGGNPYQPRQIVVAVDDALGIEDLSV